MRRWLICILLVVIIVFFSCNNLNSDSELYYKFQGSDEELSGDFAYDIDVKFEQIFEVIQKNGVINAQKIEKLTEHYLTLNDSFNLDLLESQKNELPSVRKSHDANFKLIDFSTTNFSECVLRAQYNSENVMIFSYSSENILWALSKNNKYLQSNNNSINTYTYENLGSDIGEGMTLLSPIRYYKYEGYNPLFLIESMYNQAHFGTSQERGMERFLFYRFVGMGGGIIEVDTLLLALDTYTSLLFIYAIPTYVDSVFGMPMTTSWGPVDVLAKDENGNSHLFFEYDPVGYVDADHTFVMYDWYIERQKTIDPDNLSTYYPRHTGISPYLIDIEASQ